MQEIINFYHQLTPVCIDTFHQTFSSRAKHLKWAVILILSSIAAFGVMKTISVLWKKLHLTQAKNPKQQIVKKIFDKNISTPLKEVTIKEQKLPAKTEWSFEETEDFKELIRIGDEENAKRILKEKDPNLIFEFDGTILHFIAKLDRPVEFVKILKDQGIDFSKKDRFGNTALMWAIANANNTMAKEIIELGGVAVINEQDDRLSKSAPLHLLIVKGYKDKSCDGETLEYSNAYLVKLLIDKGADVNICNGDGDTPLHLAVLRRNVEMVDCLLKHGARLDIKNKKGETPLDQLKKTFDSAKSVLCSTTAMLLFDKNEFNQHFQQVHDLLQNAAAKKNVD